MEEVVPYLAHLVALWELRGQKRKSPAVFIFISICFFFFSFIYHFIIPLAIAHSLSSHQMIRIVNYWNWFIDAILFITFLNALCTEKKNENDSRVQTKRQWIYLT